MKLSIIIPAHNEAQRIEVTLKHYSTFFGELQRHKKLETELIVVLNGCTDNTFEIVRNKQQEHKDDIHIRIIDIPQAGKGLAITRGFKDALARDNDVIGFVDADMATLPQSFYALIEYIRSYDGVIASRYMPGAQVIPPRPFVKRYGSKLIYEPLIYILFGMYYHDYQCGAKVFRRAVIEKVISHLTVQQWAFDVELLYLCKKNHFTIKEVPTIWHDKHHSKLNMVPAGLRMLWALIVVRFRHVFNQ